MSGFDKELAAALAEELAYVIGALIDAPPDVGPGAPGDGRQWIARIDATGTATGSLSMAIDATAAADITALTMGLDGENEKPPVEAVVDTLREVCVQAVSSLAQKPIAKGATLSVSALNQSQSLTPEGDWAVFAIVAEKMKAPLAVAMWGELALAGSAPEAKPAAARPAPAAAPSPAPAPAPAAPAAKPAAQHPSDRIDVILDIDLPLVVRFGHTELPLKSVTRLGPGSLIDLGRTPDEPVEILVSNQVVARGEVVIVSGSYGVRILEVVSARDRLRSMEV
ncbi:MAG TPA: FliM/FliN family flagellar motor switch protein [Vicinamibacterales bacterium]|jgi:flagellar motor switch protein FliN/FliY|nr:FliM/FliN family flagellar motor switch protein [Vicinamibacterales bacterium]